MNRYSISSWLRAFSICITLSAGVLLITEFQLLDIQRSNCGEKGRFIGTGNSALFYFFELAAPWIAIAASQLLAIRERSALFDVWNLVVNCIAALSLFMVVPALFFWANLSSENCQIWDWPAFDEAAMFVQLWLVYPAAAFALFVMVAVLTMRTLRKHDWID